MTIFDENDDYFIRMTVYRSLRDDEKVGGWLGERIRILWQRVIICNKNEDWTIFGADVRCKLSTRGGGWVNEELWCDVMKMDGYKWTSSK